MDYDHKKKLNEKINSIKDKDLFYKIFEIVKEELYYSNGNKKFTENYNGIFFDLNKISDENLIKIENLLNENLINITDSETNTVKISSNTEEKENVICNSKML